MKTLINKANPAIRVTAPEIDVHEEEEMYFIPVSDYCIPMCISDWTLVEEEPKKIYYKMLDNKANCPFDKGNCNYCTIQFCGAREENHIETRSTAEPVDFEKLALEKYPETMTYDSRGLYDRKKYDRDIYKQGMKDGYNLKHKIRNDDNNL